MGRKSSTEAVSAVLLAFLESRTWTQKGLADRAGVERKQIVRILRDLELAGLRLEREDDPPNVYWSVSKDWFPGAVAFGRDDVPDLARLLQLSPSSATRDRLLGYVASTATGLKIEKDGVVRTRSLSNDEERTIASLQRGGETSTAINCRYYTLSRGELAWRALSVHRIFPETGRFVATCHRSTQLKWFRIDGVVDLADGADTYRSIDAGQLDRFVAESADGYHSGAPPIRCTFSVRRRDAVWVKAQLPVTFEAREEDAATHFTTTTAGLLPLARFLVGLGASVRVHSPELRQLVLDLARCCIDAQMSASEVKTEHSSGGPIGPPH